MPLDTDLNPSAFSSNQFLSARAPNQSSGISDPIPIPSMSRHFDKATHKKIVTISRESFDQLNANRPSSNPELRFISNVEPLSREPSNNENRPSSNPEASFLPYNDLDPMELSLSDLYKELFSPENHKGLQDTFKEKYAYKIFSPKEDLTMMDFAIPSPEANTSPSKIQRRHPKLSYPNVSAHLKTIPLKFSNESIPESSSGTDSLSASEFEPPTQHFYEKYVEHHGDLSSYDTIIDRDEIIERERTYLETHVPLYTAFKKEVFLIQMFNAALLTLSNKHPLCRSAVNKRVWFRDAFSHPPDNIRFESMQDFLKLHKMQFELYKQPVRDYLRNTGWHLISCNPHLYGNTLQASEESTLDYFYDNLSIDPPDIRKIFDKILEDTGLDNIAPEHIKALFKKLEDCLQLLEGPYGVMQQIFIPKEEVNNLVYISKPNGVPDPDHQNPLKALLRLQHKRADQNPADKSMQVRLLVTRFIDPNIDADYIHYTYCALPETQLAAFRRAVKQVVSELIDANCANRTPSPSVDSMEG